MEDNSISSQVELSVWRAAGVTMPVPLPDSANPTLPPVLALLAGVDISHVKVILSDDPLLLYKTNSSHTHTHTYTLSSSLTDDKATWHSLACHTTCVMNTWCGHL